MAGVYTTVQGDMWDSIAHMKLGSVAHTDKLMKANLKHIAYYVFPAGVKIILPDIDVAVAEASKLPPWKRGIGV